MEEEDYEILRNEASADPVRYTEWDRQRQFRREYQDMHSHDPSYEETISRGPTATSSNPSQQPTSPLAPETALPKEASAPLSRHSSSSSSSSSASSSSSRSRSPQLQEIRTQPQGPLTPGLDRHTTAVSTAGSIYRHPTERNPEAIRRIETHRSQHQQTVGATVSRRSTAKSQKPLPTIGAGKPYPPPLPDREEYVVEYDGVDDPLHAQNWPMKKKLFLGAILAFDALAATMGSSIFSSAIVPVSRQYKVDTEVGTLGTSFFVFGYAFGPLVCYIFNHL
jgi:MFS transporter, DHA1 family, multidrug resistance protein